MLWKLVDKDWQWARYAICRFIRAVCNPMSDGVPRYPLAGNREAIGALLKPLAEDPTKSELPGEAAGRNLRVYGDSLTAAINTPRGIAVEAIIAYARVGLPTTLRGTRKAGDCARGLRGHARGPGKARMADRTRNASFEAFAVMGAYFGLLHSMDEPWVKANAERIFDLLAIELEPNSAYGWAAWNSFLEWGQTRLTIIKSSGHNTSTQ